MSRPRSRLGWRRILGRGLLAVAVIVLIWLGGFVWFAERAVIYPDPGDQAAGAIVVLTGGRERLNHGLSLLEQGRADALFVSGVHDGVSVEDLPAVRDRGPEDLPCCITLGYDADDTAGNAVETAAWVADRDIDTIRLVTSNYHMPRSLLEFRQRMPDLTIIPDPVDAEPVRLDEWYRWPGTAGLLFREYNKSLLALGRAYLGRLI